MSDPISARRGQPTSPWPARLLLAALLPACLALSAQAQGLTTVTFSNLPAGSVASYAEQGFVVTAGTGAWSRNSYGAPGPSLVFTGVGDASVTLTSISGSFQFHSVGLYSSMTVIPYTLRGTLAGQPVFTLTATQPNTFGTFATLATTSSAPIDQLTITLTNPMAGNPMGLDNITLGAVVAVPEPATASMGLLGVLVVGWRRWRLAQAQGPSAAGG